MEKSILLRKQWLIRSHGKWIWRWKICTRATLHRTCARVRMLWVKRKLACDCKVSCGAGLCSSRLRSCMMMMMRFCWCCSAWAGRKTCSLRMRKKKFFFLTESEKFCFSCGDFVSGKSASCVWLLCLRDLIICIWDFSIFSGCHLKT